MLPPNPLRILCFGDSITAGFSQFGGLFHPYAPSMQASLERAFPSINVSAEVRGVSGDQVTSPPGQFLQRMQIAYQENPNPYTFAVILGGTNDLSVNRLPPSIYSALQAVWFIPVLHKTTVLALTVPECGLCDDSWDERNLELNKLILGHESQKFYTLDFHEKMPYWRMPEKKRKEIWDDGVHFTAKGYDLMGEIIADRLIEVIKGIDELEGDEQKPQKELHAGELKRRAEMDVR